MENLPNCPKCNSEYTYEDGSLLVCPECGYEWNPETTVDDLSSHPPGRFRSSHLLQSPCSPW